MPPTASALRSLIVATASLMVAVVGPAHAIPLADLLTPGTTLESGSLRFSDFAYTSNGDMAGAGKVMVDAITLGGDAGISITGAFEDTAASLAPSAASISYSVSVLDSLPSLRITGVKVEADFSITELGYANLNANILNSSIDLIQLFAHNFLGTETRVSSSGQNSLSPSSELSVVMESIDAFAETGTAGISMIRQTFTVVPEPGTAMLLALGLFGLAFAGRRL